MHISTHHDRIWSSDCLTKEDEILKTLQKERKDSFIQLVDCLQSETSLPIITDNYFLDNRKAEYLFPEFWHIYLCDQIENIEPKQLFNCMLNRISGERLLLLYKIYERGLLDKGIISFNCLYHTRDPSVEQRKKFFDEVNQIVGWPQWNWAYRELRNKVPILTEHDPDSAAMNTSITIVAESYVSDNIIAFSEKIFRALQTPRPWMIFCSPGSVELLRSHGFDVMDDIVDHRYDSIIDVDSRLDAILDNLSIIKYNKKRCEESVRHNRCILNELKAKWPKKLISILSYDRSK